MSFIQREPGVYFLLSHDETMLKSGKSMTPRKRIYGLRHMNPHPLHALLVVPGYGGVEHWFHEKFHGYRSHGEWFHYADEVVEMVQSLVDGRTSVDRLCAPRLRDDLKQLADGSLSNTI